jgi:hypothetical protein
MSFGDEEFTTNFKTMIEEVDVFLTLSMHLNKDDKLNFKKEMIEWT